MGLQATLSLFGDAPAPLMTRPHAPVADEAMALALAYEQAVVDCQEAFRDQHNLRAQAEAGARFEAAMSAYMALPKLAYRRTKRLLDSRGRVNGAEWWEIRRRLAGGSETIRTANA